MSKPVLLADVLEALECASDEGSWHLNRKTGDVHMIDMEVTVLLDDAEDGDEVDLDDQPDWVREEYAKGREVRDSDDWLEIPGKLDVHEWEIMERFSKAIEDDLVREDLLQSIHGSGAFRHFRRGLERYGLWDVWHKFKAAALERIAIEWLEEKGIEYTRDKPA